MTKKSGFSASLFLLGCVVVLCLLMVGASGYVKYQLDRSVSTLAAPDTAFTPDQELYEKTVVALGYSGFLGAAQNFINTHDRAALGDMRMNYKTAQEVVTRLGDKTTSVVRRDMRAIMDIYAAIITKAEEGGDALATGISSTDILTAATSLGTLDNRLQTAIAANRMNAHSSMQVWGLGLMLISWLSFGIIAVMAFSMYLMVRSKKTEPMQSLLQSVDNMAQGELKNPVWGLERRDEVGDLARALDKMRQYFADVPDVTIQSDEGPTHLKFDGEARSLFQSMIKNITETFERAQQSTHGFTGAMNAQQDMLSSVTSRLNATLNQLQMQGEKNEETIRSLSMSLSEQAHSLTLAHEAGAGQISRLVPFLQERIQNMAEITHLTGNQVNASLQTILKAESTFRQSATSSETVVAQLSNTTNQMGERMFAALNLMQASGKLLNETTDTVKVRFNEAIQTLHRGEDNLHQIILRAEDRLASTINAEENMAALASRTEISAEKMERAVNNICDRHEGLSEQVVTATHRMESIVASFDAAQRSMSEATAQVRRDGNLINTLLLELRANNDQLISSVNQNSQTSFATAQGLAEKSHALMQRLEIQIQQQAQTAEGHIAELSAHGQVMAQHATSTTSSLTQTIANLKTEQDKLAATRAKFSDTINDLGSRFEQQATTTFGKTEQWAAQSYSKLSSIAEQVESVMQRLGMLGQLTGTLGAVAGQLGQLVPSLTQMQVAGSMGSAPMATSPLAYEMPSVDLEETKALIVARSEEMVKELHEQWHTAVVQIEAMHDQLAQLVIQQKDQLETRLVVMDKKLRETQESLKNGTDQTEAGEKQADIMNEIISAISKINEHVIEIDGVIEDAGLKKEVS